MHCAYGATQIEGFRGFYYPLSATEPAPCIEFYPTENNVSSGKDGVESQDIGSDGGFENENSDTTLQLGYFSFIWNVSSFIIFCPVFSLCCSLKCLATQACHGWLSKEEDTRTRNSFHQFWESFGIKVISFLSGFFVSSPFCYRLKASPGKRSWFSGTIYHEDPRMGRKVVFEFWWVEQEGSFLFL